LGAFSIFFGRKNCRDRPTLEGGVLGRGPGEIKVGKGSPKRGGRLMGKIRETWGEFLEKGAI
jgi:hypothetical protein